MRKINFTTVIEQLIDCNKKLIGCKNKEEAALQISIAKQVAINTQTVINSFKVSLEYMKLAGLENNPFFELSEITLPLITEGNSTQHPSKESEHKDIIKAKENIAETHAVIEEHNPTKSVEPSCDICTRQKACTDGKSMCPVDKYTYFKLDKSKVKR